MVRNERVHEILRDCSREKLVPLGNTLQHQREVDYDKFAQQIVGATVLAILGTNCTDLAKTTYERDFVNATIARVFDSVTQYWEFE